MTLTELGQVRRGTARCRFPRLQPDLLQCWARSPMPLGHFDPLASPTLQDSSTSTLGLQLPPTSLQTGQVDSQRMSSSCSPTQMKHCLLLWFCRAPGWTDWGRGLNIYGVFTRPPLIFCLTALVQSSLLETAIHNEDIERWRGLPKCQAAGHSGAQISCVGLLGGGGQKFGRSQKVQRLQSVL